MVDSIRLKTGTEARLDALAESAGRSRASLLRECIERGLTELEDYYGAQEVLKRVKDGSEPVHSAESVRRELK